VFGFEKEASIRVVLLFFQYPVEYRVSRGLTGGLEAGLMGLGRVFLFAVHGSSFVEDDLTVGGDARSTHGETFRR
jgi:hypothetical protein